MLNRAYSYFENKVLGVTLLGNAKSRLLVFCNKVLGVTLLGGAKMRLFVICNKFVIRNGVGYLRNHYKFIIASEVLQKHAFSTLP